jgi:hypothetical protein
MSDDPASLRGMFSPAELQALAAAADGMKLETWLRHVVLRIAGQADGLDEPEELQATPALPAADNPPPIQPADGPDLAGLARKLDELSTLVSTKLAAMAAVLEHIRDSQLQWHKAVLFEICAHTAFPDERARRLGLAKAERDVAAAEAHITQAIATASRERRARAGREPQDLPQAGLRPVGDEQD